MQFQVTITVTITVTTGDDNDPADTLEEIQEVLSGTMLDLTERGWSGTVDIVGKRE